LTTRLAALATASFLALGLGSCDKNEEALPVGSQPPVPNWAEQQGFASNKQAVRGAEIFAQVGCLNCHTYLGAGASNMGAPDLTAIGKRNRRTVEGYANYVSDPSQFSNQVMPRFEELGRRNLLALGAFLQASKGER
jgi:mono/diheme cytochrome c family protein